MGPGRRIRAVFSLLSDKALDQVLRPLLPLRRDRPLPAMVRRGVAGRSDELLSPERQRELDAWCEARLRELGSDFPYAERFASEPR